MYTKASCVKRATTMSVWKYVINYRLLKPKINELKCDLAEHMSFIMAMSTTEYSVLTMKIERIVHIFESFHLLSIEAFTFFYVPLDLAIQNYGTCSLKRRVTSGACTDTSTLQWTVLFTSLVHRTIIIMQYAYFSIFSNNFLITKKVLDASASQSLFLKQINYS